MGKNVSSLDRLFQRGWLLSLICIATFFSQGGLVRSQDEAPLRVYIMTDMEGVAGVLDSENWCTPQSRYYQAGKELLTREVNAAIEGFISAGATEILVADGHGWGGIDPAMLDSRAQLSRNWPAGKSYPFSMNSRKFDFAAWIGQHPKAGTPGGHLCHTGSMNVRDKRINGISVGEFGEGVMSASELGVSVIFASGCEAFCREARELLPGIETVAVKRGLQDDPGHDLPAEAYARHNLSAIHLAPEKARELIREGANKALTRARSEKFGLLTVRPPYEAVIVLRSDSSNAARVGRKRHDRSVIDLLNLPWVFEPVAFDPAEAIGK
jgi:D-amino peptidase